MSQVERAVTITSLGFHLRVMPWWWRFDEGTGRAREYGCENFLLKLGKVSFKAGEESS